MVKNRLDKLTYAVKKVRLDNTLHAQKENDRILREVALLSRLSNQYIVRYYQAWIEDIDDEESEGEEDSITEEDSSIDNSKNKMRHSSSSHDFSISKIIPSERPKYFEKDNLEDSDSDDLIFEENDSIEFEDPESYSDKSETILNKVKDQKKRGLYIQMEY